MQAQLACLLAVMEAVGDLLDGSGCEVDASPELGRNWNKDPLKPSLNSDLERPQVVGQATLFALDKIVPHDAQRSLQRSHPPLLGAPLTVVLACCCFGVPLHIDLGRRPHEQDWDLEGQRSPHSPQ